MRDTSLPTNAFTNKEMIPVPAASVGDNPATAQRLMGMGLQSLSFDNADAVLVYHNVSRRNHFIHPDAAAASAETRLIYSLEGFMRLLTSVQLIVTRLGA